MPLVIPNTTSDADYTTFGGSGNYTSGFVTITGSALALLRIIYGTQGSGQYSDDIPLAPGTYPLAGTREQPIAGVAIKDFVSGSHVQFSGALFAPWEAAVIAGAPSAAQITPGGTVVNTGFASGMIVPYGGATAPTGFVLCDGATYDGTEASYLGLWTVIGNTYGGSGQSAFKVPDLQGRVPVMKGTNADVNAFNANEGLAIGSRSPKHITSISDPGHGHGINDPGHAHTTPNNNDGSVSGAFGSFVQTDHGRTDSGQTDADATGVTVASNTTGISVGPGGSRPTDTPAFLVVNYLIAL